MEVLVVTTVIIVGALVAGVVCCLVMAAVFPLMEHVTDKVENWLNNR